MTSELILQQLITKCPIIQTGLQAKKIKLGSQKKIENGKKPEKNVKMCNVIFVEPIYISVNVVTL